ncbi:MAG: GGDEF domain-containing protein [Lachnospiraceae bacterium]|nr:GGDEF domain-containing protein [Lachnospiraceae bacterium]
MIQKTYHFYDIGELNSIIHEIENNEDYKNAKGVLLQLYNPRLDIDEDLMVETIAKRLPKSCLSGVTAANIVKEEYDLSNNPVELSMTCFKNTILRQYDLDMENSTAFVAGRMINESLERFDNLKCLQICYASNSSSVCTFMREFSHYNIPRFGIKAGRNIRKNNTAHVYGQKVYSNAFVVIAFLSDSLKLYMDNNFGWCPIGIEMTITGTRGDTIVTEIDKKNPTEIFSRYLRVIPDKYFVQNVCEFPLIIMRDDYKIARVPSAYDEDGSVHFTSDVHRGDHFRLSYADKLKLMSLTQKSASDLSDFNPEAVFIFECGNRVRFMRADYKKEIDIYREVSPELSSVSGYAELFVDAEGEGGALNSSMVVIGLKEDEGGEDQTICCRVAEPVKADDVDYNGEVPFLDRVLAFLESTSQDLNKMNKELGKLAYTDRLTKIYNRWELEKKVNEALEFSDENDKCGLIFMDIDHFKAVNDTYGHDIGDMVLLAVVNMIKEFLQPGHAFGRWGGEEFIYMIPKTDEKSLFDFAESIRKCIDEICFVTVKHITISLGCTLSKKGDTLEILVKRADEAVYEAKETGRNKVVFHKD